MRAIVNTGPGRLEMQDRPTPTPGPGQVRIRTAACGICVTDLKMIAGWERTGFPAIPGHEWSGVVDAAGPGADPQLVGRRCVAENVLADGGEVGFEHPGGYAEFLITEARNVQPLPADFPLTVAALIEPLAVAVRAVRRLRLEDRSAALVFGDGPLGLILLMLLCREGVKEILLVGGRPGRLELARQLGATHTLNYHEVNGDLGAAVKAAAGHPFPNAIEAAGSGAAAQACLDAAAHEGRVLVIGEYERARAGFPWERVLIGELEIIGSNASSGAWPEAVRLATAARLPLERLVTQRLPAARFAEGVELVRSRRPDVIKVVLEWS
jgi:threonine dehydrogenase-like Zn-dependent dehydrogenase